MAKKEPKVINKKEKNSKDKTSFFKSFKAELKRVSWPTPKQLVNNTVAVVVIVLILAAIVFVLDLAFESVNKYGIDKIKESVITTEESNNSTTEESVDNSAEGSSEDEDMVEPEEPEEITEQDTETVENQ